MTPADKAAPPGRLCVFSAGLAAGPINRMLRAAGWEVSVGWPRAGDSVGVWGHGRTAWRGEAVARRTGAPLVRIEDAFLRSLHPGRAGGPPLGLLIDATGAHYDPRGPSDLETLLATHPLDDPALLARAAALIMRMKARHLTKYGAVDPAEPLPPPGYVLVVDQARGDASVRLGSGDARFAEMLGAARDAHPGARIVIKTHPETRAGIRPGHFAGLRDDGDTIRLTAPVSPWPLLERAAAVYTHSSQLGFEAILAGHAPHVFGQPFYTGWGLTRDAAPPNRRGRQLAAAQMAAAALILYPVWICPYRRVPCPVEEAMDALEAQARAWREDRAGYVASGIRLWKRPYIRRFFGSSGRLSFENAPLRARISAEMTGRPVLAWARHATGGAELRVEDGFLRSRGLGAELVPPLSLVRDDLGIYYDPSRPSRLERLIADGLSLSAPERDRAERLIALLVEGRLSKYNVGGPAPSLPQGRRILVPGQVEDDASIRVGAGALRTNGDLIRTVRQANPDAVIVYKPHPDVEAGLRPGAIDPDAQDMVDLVARGADPTALLAEIDEVWTMTSLLGFEALLRDIPVTCTGTPFYAGWGLTRDLRPAPPRRIARPTRLALVHAALIAYPRYCDPVTGLPCPVEIAALRLRDEYREGGPANRFLSRAQGLAASYLSAFWR